MMKMQTIPQFYLYDFLHKRFALESMEVTPLSGESVQLRDRDGNAAIFVYRDGAVSMHSVDVEEEPAQDPEEARIPIQRMEESVRLTLRQVLGLPKDLFQHFMTHPIPTDKEVRRLVSQGDVSTEDYMGILLWYLGGKFHRHYLGWHCTDEEDPHIYLIYAPNPYIRECFKFHLKEAERRSPNTSEGGFHHESEQHPTTETP